MEQNFALNKTVNIIVSYYDFIINKFIHKKKKNANTIYANGA